MWFYGCLKGLSEDEVQSELDTLLEDVGLLHKRHEQTRNLSGNITVYLKKCICINSPAFVQFWVLCLFCWSLCQAACRGNSLWPLRLSEAPRWSFWMSPQPGSILTHAEGSGICCSNTEKVQEGMTQWECACVASKFRVMGKRQWSIVVNVNIRFRSGH